MPRINIAFEDPGKSKWNSIPRDSLPAVKIWRHLQKIATGDEQVLFEGKSGLEPVHLFARYFAHMHCSWNDQFDQLTIWDIQISEV
ncbi:MAG: hypothetical protein FWD61_05910 [Phycisphaerales bacterium]|nr:hypothetical protein [Phycisphaerales bacterium]